jgi:hypothetical protein
MPMEGGSGLVGPAFGGALSQRRPIIMGSRPVILRVRAVQTGVAAFGPVTAVPMFVRRGQQPGAVQVVLTLVGVSISGVGAGVTCVGGGQDRLGGLRALREGGFASRDFGLASFDIGLASFEIGRATVDAIAHGWHSTIWQ